MNEDMMSWVNDIFNIGFSDGIYNELREYAGSEYLYGDFYDNLRASENAEDYLINLSINIAKKHAEELAPAISRNLQANDVPLDAIIIAIASELLRLFEHDINKHKAYNYAEEFSKIEKNIEIYETEKRAWDKGYDKYMENNIKFMSSYVDRIANVYCNTETIKR